MPSSRRTPRRREHPGFESLRCGGRERPPYRTRGTSRPTKDLALPQTPAGGINPSPYNQRRARGQPRNRRPCVITNLCRGRCSHCARRRVSEANRTAGPALRPEIVPGTLRRRNVPGRAMALPYKLRQTPGRLWPPSPAAPFLIPHSSFSLPLHAPSNCSTATVMSSCLFPARRWALSATALAVWAGVWPSRL